MFMLKISHTNEISRYEITAGVDLKLVSVFKFNKIDVDFYYYMYFFFKNSLQYKIQ